MDELSKEIASLGYDLLRLNDVVYLNDENVNGDSIESPCVECSTSCQLMCSGGIFK